MIQTRPLPPQDALKSYVRYEPETGKLFWLPQSRDRFESDGIFKSWNTKYANKEAFIYTNARGYRLGNFNGIQYMTHRLIWRLVTGNEPREIDHINGDRADNRWCNLREVSRIENSRNKGVSSKNKSGHLGIYWSGRKQAWVARITATGRELYLGCFPRIEDAVEARRAASEKYGYHPNHGRRV